MGEPRPAGGPPDREFEEAGDLLAVQETLRGNRNAFTAVVERYSPLLYSLAFRTLGYPDEAEEAVQEIFLRAFRGLAGFRLGRRFHPWLYTIALNYLRTRARRQHRQRRTAPLEFTEEIQAVTPDESAESPGLRLEREEGERLAQKALERLALPYREVFVLRQIEGLSVRDAAEALGIPEGTVKVRLHRARLELVRQLAISGWA